jgi:hypothetical protein
MVCTIENCTNPINCRGLCNRHYARWQRHGDPLGGGDHHRPPGLTVAQVLALYVRHGQTDECWPWTRGIKNRYGVFGKLGRQRYAHRAAYEIHHSVTLTSEDVVRHTCDNPPCCNPNHLVLGTHADNIQDARDRDRANPWGWKNGGPSQTPHEPTVCCAPDCTNNSRSRGMCRKHYTRWYRMNRR